MPSDDLNDDKDDALRDMVRHINEEFFPGPSWRIGDIVRHPDGRRVKIVSGQFWTDPIGKTGLSNFWSWHAVDAGGGQIGEIESGYGWEPEAGSAHDH